MICQSLFLIDIWWFIISSREWTSFTWRRWGRRKMWPATRQLVCEECTCFGTNWISGCSLIFALHADTRDTFTEKCTFSLILTVLSYPLRSLIGTTCALSLLSVMARFLAGRASALAYTFQRCGLIRISDTKLHNRIRWPGGKTSEIVCTLARKMLVDKFLNYNSQACHLMQPPRSKHTLHNVRWKYLAWERGNLHCWVKLGEQPFNSYNYDKINYDNKTDHIVIHVMWLYTSTTTYYTGRWTMHGLCMCEVDIRVCHMQSLDIWAPLYRHYIDTVK